MKLRIRLILLVVLSFQTILLLAQSPPAMRTLDKYRIREAIKIADLYGEKLWPGIIDSPFAIILITDSVEYLINHPHPSVDFNFVEKDSILKTDIYYRKQQFPLGLQATFPAVNGINCIVIGTPENTGLTTTEWIATVLHEHFHQYQYSYPDYYQSVEKLGLSGADNSGMWMLNYPFPYENSKVIVRFDQYKKALLNLLGGFNNPRFNSLFIQYKKSRDKLKAIHSPSDYRYFSFQIWQEGIARYTEYKMLELMQDYQPSAVISNLPDFESFEIYKNRLYQSQAKQLFNMKIQDYKRLCFYAAGFVDGLLLDKLNPGWRSAYHTDKFFIEKYSSKF